MIQSINRALDILEFLAQDPENSKSLSEIAAATGLNPATASNLIKTLVERKYIEQEGPRKGYLSGIMCGLLGSKQNNYRILLEVSTPYLKFLAETLRESVFIVVLKNGQRCILEKIECQEILKINLNVIYASDVLTTTTGNLLLAYLSPMELKAFLLKSDITEKEEANLRITFEKIREDGFFIRRTYGGQVYGVAYPIYKSAKVIAALGLYLPSLRFEGEHRENILREMGKAAGEISEILTQELNGDGDIRNSVGGDERIGSRGAQGALCRMESFNSRGGG